MKYILADDGEWRINFTRYSAYLETIRNDIPSHIYEFASAEKHFTLNSPHSLHDSWLNSLEIRESRNPDRPFEPCVGITLKLMGQDGDRIIILNYEAVRGYRVEGQKNAFNYADTFHGDVITHEVRLSETRNLIHELIYRSESSLVVECKNFTHREELIQPPSANAGL